MKPKSDNSLHGEITREDLRMLQSAVKNRWPIPKRVFGRLVEKAAKAIESETGGMPDRTALRAMELIKDINAQNIQIDQQIDKDARADDGKASGVTEIRVTYEATPGARDDGD